MPHSARRQRLREVLTGPRCIHTASVFDPLSARIAEDLGFEIGMFAGSIAALAILGDPDLTLITLTELAEQVWRIARASSLPLLVDADHGYGNAMNVRRTVAEMEAAGAAGFTLEDTELPRPFGPDIAPRAIPIVEAVGKLTAALEARSDPALVIVGRTGLGLDYGLAGCLERVAAYSATGVDAVFISGLKTRAELDAIAEVSTAPLILGGPKDEVDEPGYLASRNVRLCLRGHRPFQAAVHAVYQTLVVQRTGAVPADAPSPTELIKRLSRADAFAAMDRKYMGR